MKFPKPDPKSIDKAKKMSDKIESQDVELIHFSDVQVSTLVKPFISAVEAIKAEEKAFKVTSLNKEACNEFATRVKKLSRRLDEKRKEIKKPYLEFEQFIDGLLMPLVNSLKEAEKNLGTKLTAVLREERRLAQEEANRLAEKAAQDAYDAALKDGATKKQAEHVGTEVATVVFSNAASAVPTGLTTASGSSALKTKKDFKVIDMAKVPVNFLTIDRAAVKAALDAGITAIPGLEIFDVENIQFRSR